MGEPFLEVQKITKRFPGVVALSGVDLQVYPAEILALIGENGAGKSTLMKILAGVQAADDGELLVEGKAVRFSGVQDAQKSGIALIHQELNLAENLTVAANMFLGREPENMSELPQLELQPLLRAARESHRGRRGEAHLAWHLRCSAAVTRRGSDSQMDSARMRGG